MMIRNAAIVALLLLPASALLAQNGCVNSPECPTAILAVVGVSAMTLVRRFKRS